MSSLSNDQASFLAGGGEMGERIRAFDWAGTPIGPPEQWPQSLRSAVSILLPSKAQIVLFWGRDLITIYNDAYRTVLGAKHPHVLGLPARETWSEIWDGGLRDLFEGVLETGLAYWAENRPFYLRRHGFLEETLFDVSYDPVRDESGAVGGVFCIVSETTRRVLGERRMKALRDVGEHTAGAQSAEEAMRLAADALGDVGHDVPFALLYLLDDAGRRATLAAASSMTSGTPASPETIELDDVSAAWPLAKVMATGEAIPLSNLGARFGELPGGPWPEPTDQAVVLPLKKPGQDRPAGFLVAGVSPRLALDDEYRGFLDLLAGHVAAAVANARAWEEERRRTQALAELDRAKTAFFSNVSHEFRTPLTLMLGPVEDLLLRRHSDLSPTATRQLEIVQRNGLRLLRLVNTLLDFSRIEAGRARGRFQPTDLAASTTDLASVFRATIERAGLRLVVDCPSLPQPVYVDRDMWEKIVLNLLSNAFKFTFDGTISVRLRAFEGAAVLRVKDTGTGIPPDELPRLFERFHRIPNARGRTHEGSGIGLALVQELVRQHGGTIAVESVLGEGSLFSVTVPLGAAHLPAGQVQERPDAASGEIGSSPFVEEAARWLPEEDGSEEDVFLKLEGVLPGPGPDSDSGGRRPVILLADDNADMRHYLARLLGERYVVRVESDGEAALASVRADPPDLVLTDVMMPRLDGFGLLEALRQDRATQDIPVILLSARAGEESRVEGMEAGTNDYLIKPFSARELVARVSAHLQIARLRHQANDVLRRSEADLREADRRKDEFLAILAHELRGPLAPLSNMLELLKQVDEVDGALLRVARGTMERQTQQLVRLVDDLMDVSRITRNRLELRLERVELANVLRHAVETTEPLCATRRFRGELASEPLPVLGDPARLSQVFHNLIHNACKYTTDPSDEVRLTAEREGNFAVVRITDTGVGIPKEMLTRVFELFTQVDRSLDRTQAGLGIGLALVKRLVEMHGGTVVARSDGNGKGSTFEVRLPLALGPVAGGPGAAGRSEEESSGVAPRRILVVDDSEDSATSLAMLLTVMGHQVRMARDGLDAVEAAERFLPEIVFLDLGMPRLHGYDAARRIREQPWGADMILVALTGWGQDEDRRRSREAGFDAHLVKPVNVGAVRSLMASRSG